MKTLRIRVMLAEGLHHLKSNQHFWGPGEYDFRCAPTSEGWLLGHAERGNVQILGEVGPEGLKEYVEGLQAAANALQSSPVPSFVPGQAVLLQRGAARIRTTVEAVNADGTVKVAAQNKPVDPAKLSPVTE